MKCSYFVFSHSVLLCPNLYSIFPPFYSLYPQLLNPPDFFRDGFVSLTHGFSAMTDCERPSLSPINRLHGPHRKHLLLQTCLQFCCLALGMARTTLKTSHVTAISPIHRGADFCLATGYKYSSYCCVIKQRTLYQESAFAGTCLPTRCLAMGVHLTISSYC
jgi:hypothetical protein